MMKHGGRFLSPCSFLAKQRKSTDHTDDTDLSCVGASEKFTQKSQKFLSTDHTEKHGVFRLEILVKDYSKDFC